jgi:HEAT repeat protein
VRCQLLLALAALRPEGGVPEAVRLLGGANAEERAAAAEALSLSPTPAGAGAAARALAAPGLDPALRANLAGALLAGRDPAGVEVLLGYLADPDVVLRRRAWAALDRWVEGLGPFDPEGGTGVAETRARWEAQAASPRFRAGTVPGR